FTILANSAFGVADPAQNYTLQQWQLLIDTHDGLVGFAKVGGVAGSKIVPDLATSIPTPTNGGKPYLLHIRKGIKFSNGQTLKLTGNNVPPGTGPYMWKSYNPNTQAVLVRNPYFHVWNATAQPEGYPNEIIEKYGLLVSDEVRAVQNGQANEVYDGDQIPSDQLSQLNSPNTAGRWPVKRLPADGYSPLTTGPPRSNNFQPGQATN